MRTLLNISIFTTSFLIKIRLKKSSSLNQLIIPIVNKVQDLVEWYLSLKLETTTKKFLIIFYYSLFIRYTSIKLFIVKLLIAQTRNFIDKN